MSLSNFCKVSERVLSHHVIILQPIGKKQLIEEPTLAEHNTWPVLHDTEGHGNVDRAEFLFQGLHFDSDMES